MLEMWWPQYRAIYIDLDVILAKPHEISLFGRHIESHGMLHNLNLIRIIS